MISDSVDTTLPEDDDVFGEEPDDAESSFVGVETSIEVTCPYCSEVVAIGLDPGGGAAQDYVEDCQVCCRPWRVRVSYDEEGNAEVWVEQTH